MPILQFIVTASFCRYADQQIPKEYKKLQEETECQHPLLSQHFRLLLISFLGDYALWIYKETRCSMKDLYNVMDQMAETVSSQFNIEKVS